MNANEQLFDDAIRHQIYLQGFNNRQVTDMLAMLRKVEKRVLFALMEPTTGYGEARLNNLLKTVRGIMSDGYGGITEATQIAMKGVANHDVDWQTAALSRAMPVDVSLTKPSANQIWAAVTTRPFSGRIMSEWFDDMERGAYRRIKDTIRLGYVDGTPTDKIIRQIRGTKALGFKDGVIGINRRHLETVVRTAVGHSAAAARMRTIEQNSDVVKGVIWRSTLDTRTSPICRPRDGKKYDTNRRPVGHSFSWLGGAGSAHPNCRSTAIPWLKSWKEMGIDLKEAPAGTRASLNGQVPADMSYDQWLRGQSAKVQAQALGPTKAKLFRDGELKIGRFQNNHGIEYTLDQLKARDAEAWAKAFGKPVVVTPRPKPRPAPKPAPKPAPRPSPAPQPTPTGFTPLKNVAAAQEWAEANIAERVAFTKGTRISVLNEVLETSLEMERRFAFRKLDYFGDPAQDATARWGSLRKVNAAFGMSRNTFLFTNRLTGKRSYDAARKWADNIDPPYVEANAFKLKDWRYKVGIVDEKPVGFDGRNRSYDSRRVIRSDEIRRLANLMDADDKARVEFSISMDARGTTIHETGHRFHAENLEELDRLLDFNKIHRDQWGVLVSEYALSNAKEYIAETFAIYIQGGESQFYRIHPVILKFYQSKDVDHVR